MGNKRQEMAKPARYHNHKFQALAGESRQALHSRSPGTKGSTGSIRHPATPAHKARRTGSIPPGYPTDPAQTADSVGRLRLCGRLRVDRILVHQHIRLGKASNDRMTHLLAQLMGICQG